MLLFLDRESPSFGQTCPVDFRTTADKGKNYTTVSWPPVVATDNSGINPVVTSSGVTPKYYKGKHLVVYNASDQAGNFKICQFYISVDGKLSIAFDGVVRCTVKRLLTDTSIIRTPLYYEQFP